MTDNVNIIPLGVGDTVALGTLLVNLHLMGVVTDINTPNMFSATMEAFGDQALLTVPVLQGTQGDQGEPQFALRFQNDTAVTTPGQLPTDLTNTTADIGKYWVFKELDGNNNVIGSTMYVWYGTEYRQLPVGSQGPPGPYPVIRPLVNIIDSTLISFVEVSGPASNPQWTLNLAVPSGPPGPSTSFGTAPDFDLSTPPAIGQVIGFNGRYNTAGEPVFQMMNVGDIIPMPYTIPESAFQAYSGITATRQTICTWDAPAQPWPWKPFVWGQLEIAGFEVSATKMYGNPLLIGAEVRINDPQTGPLVARGFGNSAGAVTLVPHSSAPSTPSNAMTPSNTYALVQAGASTKLYINLYNDGMASIYDYDPRNSQVAVLQLPIGTTKALPTIFSGNVGGRGGYTATWQFSSGS